MDAFYEKMINKKPDSKDNIIKVGIIILAIILVPLALMVPFANWVLAAGIVFGAYYLITSRSIEFEYTLTNDNIDIDKIIAKRKRKRIFSGSCKEFEIIARVGGDKYTSDIKNIQKKVMAATSPDSKSAYFTVANYKGQRTLVIFEPDERMITTFKTLVPRKTFE